MDFEKHEREGRESYMGKVGILTEKPSAARNFAKALGGASGTYDGEDYVIVAARGHLLELDSPEKMVPKDLHDKYKKWSLSELPWNAGDFRWALVKKEGAASILTEIGRVLGGCEEVVIASDIDPTGEGDLLAWEIIDYLDLHDKKISRMEFVDEAPASLQKAFTARRAVTSMQDEGNWRKSDYRTKFDMLSMQWTRMATKLAASKGREALLRNGRLKSAMNVIVGDGLEAHNNYVKKPFFENRFRDEMGVVYSDPEVDRFETKSEVPANLSASAVVNDGVTRKKIAPPKLLDLSGLSSILSKEGFKPKDVLATYQKMYEAQVVSYPRTEDKSVTPEQFDELLPKIDAIAAVVGVDPAALSVRSPRKTHVKPKGAHGANRPGLNVPASLDAVVKSYGALGGRIYDILARNYLRMLAPDYEFDQHRGHVADYPTFKGSVNVPQVKGWKGIFDDDDDDDQADDDAKATGLGTMAEPFVHEGFPPRPPHPTMSWLMKKLEKADIGTGATRTSTFSEVTSGKTALMAENRGKVTLTQMGELNHRLLPGTTIGDLELTKRVYENMDAIAAGTLTTDEALDQVAGLIEQDMKIMMDNANALPKEIGEKLMSRELKEKYEGVFKGEAVSFNRVVAQHRLSDEECAKLCAGEKISFKGTSKDGSTFDVYGDLAEQTFVNDEGKTVEYVGFRYLRDPKLYVTANFQGQEISFKRKFSGHEFTQSEIDDLLAGKEISFTAISKKGSEYEARGKLGQGEFRGRKFWGFQLDTSGWKK